MAQVVEQQSCKPKALSSNPILPKKKLLYNLKDSAFGSELESTNTTIQLP
jgi:hypothetical protein